MEVIVRRLFVRERSLFGTLAFEGEEPQCFTLEDMPRPTKIAGETCIPAGRYEVKLRTFGRLYESYRARYPWNDPGMLWLQAVPNFTDILVHCGNTHEQTAGCLLVGARAEVHRPCLTGSLEAYERVYKRVMGALVAGHRAWFVIESPRSEDDYSRVLELWKQEQSRANKLDALLEQALERGSTSSCGAMFPPGQFAVQQCTLPKGHAGEHANNVKGL